VLAEVVAGRAHQVAHVLDEQQIERAEVPAGERAVHHLGVELADCAVDDLLDRGAALA